MINENSILAIIPARGGSKGILRKNIRELAGKPLIAWTIEEALKSRYIDRLILSSEDEEIISVAKRWGCEAPFTRPAELARDDTPGIKPVIHALGVLGGSYEYVVLLQPTSPLRISEDIDKCIELCVRKEAPACVSVSEVTQHPFWMYEIDDNSLMKPYDQKVEVVNRRQELPEVFIINGAVYVSRVDSIIENQSFVTPSTIAYLMPKERSYDIDEEIDLRLCEIVLGMKGMSKDA